MSARVLWLRVALLVIFVGTLELACRTGIIERFTMIPPSEMAMALGELLASPKGRAPIVETLRVVAICLVIAVVAGVLLGLTLFASPRLKRVSAPLLTSYYAVPIFVLYPTFIVIFGLNDIPLIIIGSLFAVIVMAVNVLNGLERIPPVLLKVARMHGLSPARTAWKVMLPSALPYLLTGLKLALAYAFIGVIAGEFILSPDGLGHAIAFAYNGFDNRTMYALLLFVLVLAAGLNLGLHAWEQRLLRRLGKP